MPASKTKSAAKDAIALLKADHRKVEELFEKFQSARGRKAGVESDMLDEANVEHDGAKVLIAELEAGSPDDEFYDAKVKVLSEEIKHHVKEEEKRGGIFTGAREKDLDLEALGRQIAARKAELKAAFAENGLPTPMTVTMKAPPLEQQAAA